MSNNYKPKKIKAVKTDGDVTGYVFEFDIDGVETIINVTIADHAGENAQETQQNIYKYVQETLAQIIKGEGIMQAQQPEPVKIEEEDVPIDAFVQQFGVGDVEITDDVVENVDVL